MTRQTGGLRAKKSGDACEEALTKCVLEPLRRMGEIGRYDKLNPELKRLPSGAFWPVKDSGGDWIICGRGGLYIAAEAKSTAEDRFSRNIIPQRQQDHLEDALSTGGLAFLFLRFTKQAIPICYMLPWRKVPWRVLVSAQSVSADECKSWAVFGVRDAKRILIEERNGR